ncbi:hypothetical protein FF1_019809 [Malus domestica]
MASAVDPAGDPIPTSAVLLATAKHIQFSCKAENVAFLKYKKNDLSPKKCLDKAIRSPDESSPYKPFSNPLPTFFNLLRWLCPRAMTVNRWQES